MRDKNKRRISVLVSAQTAWNLEKLAYMAGQKDIGRVTTAQPPIRTHGTSAERLRRLIISESFLTRQSESVASVCSVNRGGRTALWKASEYCKIYPRAEAVDRGEILCQRRLRPKERNLIGSSHANLYSWRRNIKKNPIPHFICIFPTMRQTNDEDGGSMPALLDACPAIA